MAMTKTDIRAAAKKVSMSFRMPTVGGGASYSFLPDRDEALRIVELARSMELSADDLAEILLGWIPTTRSYVQDHRRWDEVLFFCRNVFRVLNQNPVLPLLCIEHPHLKPLLERWQACYRWMEDLDKSLPERLEELRFIIKFLDAFIGPFLTDEMHARVSITITKGWEYWQRGLASKDGIVHFLTVVREHTQAPTSLAPIPQKLAIQFNKRADPLFINPKALFFPED